MDNMFQDWKDRSIRFLLWSQKYTKTDMLYLARGGFSSAIIQVAGITVSLLLAVTVSHFVPKESYGVYKYILSIVGILSLFSLNSIGSAVFQSAAQGFDGVLARAFWDNIRWSVAVFAGTLLLATYYFFMGNNTLGAGILIGGALSPILASASLFSSFLGGKKDFYRQALYGVIDVTVPVLIFIGIVMLTSNPIVLVTTFFITNTVAALYFYRRTIEVYRSHVHIHDENMLSYSKHLSFMGIINGVANYIDQVLIFHFLGGAQLAVYNFAIAIPDQLKSPVKNIASILQPRFVEYSAREIQKNIGRKILLMFVGSVGVTVLYIIVAPDIFHMLFPKYAEAAKYSQLYALWMLTIAADPMATYLVARKLTSELYVNTTVYSVFQLVGITVGVLLWGIAGVIIARIVTRIAMLATNVLLYRRAIKREIALDTTHV
ncbi:MAG: polysaccharide biosynthesis protein [Parcubacteria group bacterium Greene0714_7]|nr:MAG: polysaccharide biosynthesis protein [Parcubacteria group bacterium Greene0714_7]